MTRKQIDKFLSKLLDDNLVFAPVEIGENVKVKQIKDLAEIDWSGQIPQNSFKSIFYPVKQAILEYQNDKIKEIVPKIEKKVVWGMNILDLNILDRLSQLRSKEFSRDHILVFSYMQHFFIKYQNLYLIFNLIQ